MAGFCYNCIRTIDPDIPPHNNDMAHGETGQLLWDICEECGPGWFDAQGKRIPPSPKPDKLSQPQ